MTTKDGLPTCDDSRQTEPSRQCPKFLDTVEGAEGMTTKDGLPTCDDGSRMQPAVLSRRHGCRHPLEPGRRPLLPPDREDSGGWPEPTRRRPPPSLPAHEVEQDASLRRRRRSVGRLPAQRRESPARRADDRLAGQDRRA